MLHIIKQNDEKDCGAACLAMIADYYKINCSLIKARELLKIDNNGCSVFAITKASEEIGLQATGLVCDGAEDLIKGIQDKEVSLPLIAHVISKHQLLHFVVIKNIRKDSITIIDPGKGKIVLTLKKFIDIWSGVVIAFKATDSVAMEKRENPYFAFFVKHSMSLKREISLVSLLSLINGFLAIGNVVVIQSIISLLFFPEEVHSLHEHNMIPLHQNVIYLFVFLLVLSLLTFIVKIILVRNFTKISSKFESHIYEKAIRKIFILPADYFETRRTGEVVTRFSDVNKLKESYINIISILFSDVIMLVIVNLIAFILCRHIIIIEVFLFFAYIILVTLQKNKINDDVTRYFSQNELFISYITKSISSINVLRNLENVFFLKKLLQKGESLVESNKKLAYRTMKINALNAYISDLAIAGIIFGGFFLYSNKTITEGNFFVAFLLINFLIVLIKNIAGLHIYTENYKRGVDRINDLLLASEKGFLQKSHKVKLEEAPMLEFRHVSFAYGYRNNTLKDISFKVNKGESMAIVGHSGCGKTTIAKLILGYYEPEYGKIFRKGLRIAYLPQETIVYNETIKDNILLGRPVKSEEWFNYICKITYVNEIVESKPNGFDTIMDEKGFDFSKGERQRIAIARTLVEDPDIIILDEMGSNLDSATEKSIIEQLMSGLSNKIIVLITHRLSSIRKCSNILVMDEGEIRECGSHEELIEHKDLYYKMWTNQ